MMTNDTTYECVKEMIVYNAKTKDPIDVKKGTKWKLTLIESVDSFQVLTCDAVNIALPDELVDRHFKKI